MDLIIFDVDGTITDSAKVDDGCFVQTFCDLYHINLRETNQDNYEHVTDSGLTNEIFVRHLNRKSGKKDIQTIKSYFKGNRNTARG